MQDDVLPKRKKNAQKNEVNDTPVQSTVRGKMQTKKAIVAIAILCGVLGVVGTAVFYKKYQDVKSNPSQAQKAQNSAETQRVLGQLKQVLRIDESEAPTVARVEDPAKLKSANQEFYKNVEKGDYLIIFPKRAVVYRETINQIINIAPIISTSGASAEQDSATKPSTTPAAPATRTTTR